MKIHLKYGELLRYASPRKQGKIAAAELYSEVRIKYIFRDIIISQWYFFESLKFYLQKNSYIKDTVDNYKTCKQFIQNEALQNYI